MSLDKDVVLETHNLNQSVHANAAQYFHSRPIAVSASGIVLPNKRRHAFEFEYDLKDIFLIAALTHSSLLMTGATDSGKTTLAKLVMNGLFGQEDEQWHRIDIDTDFGKDTYTNPDFSIITNGKKMSEGFYSPQGFLALPGLIADEMNRAHAAIVNKLLHVFDKDISLPDGRRFKMGHPYAEGRFYQFQIAAINEGRGYEGTFGIDKALRRRTIVEIPMDVFPMMPWDRRRMLEEGQKEIVLGNNKSHLDEILSIHSKINNLPLHPSAQLFLAYLESFDYCKYSLTGDKGSVDVRGDSVRHVCTQPVRVGGTAIGNATGMGCEMLRSFENELCPYVRGISAGISKNLVAVAKGFALLRANKFAEMMTGYLEGRAEMSLSYRVLISRGDKLVASLDNYTASLQGYIGQELTGEKLTQAALDKYIQTLEVEKEDIHAALLFVGYSKIGIAKAWIEKHYQGNRHAAIEAFSRQASAKFEEGLQNPAAEEIEQILDGKTDLDRTKALEEYCRANNPWFWKVVSPYLAKNNIAPLEPDKVLRVYGS